MDDLESSANSKSEIPALPAPTSEDPEEIRRRNSKAEVQIDIKHEIYKPITSP